MSDAMVVQNQDALTALQPLPSMSVDPYIGMIERAARDPSVDPARLVQLYELAERARTARAKESFNAAMAGARGEIGPIFKNRVVDFSSAKGRTNYRHEDFAEVARTVDGPLAAHGLSYRFKSSQEGKRLTVTCIVSHAAGYSEETTLFADYDETGNKNPIQAVGSAATYLQRYTLKLALGLAATLDDDSRGATVDAKAAPITEAKLTRLESLIAEAGASLENVLTAYQVESLDRMTATQAADAEARLLRQKAKKTTELAK